MRNDLRLDGDEEMMGTEANAGPKEGMAG